MMETRLKEALLSLADDIEAGTLVPGEGALARAHDLRDVATIPFWGLIAEANDRAAWPEVVGLLRRAASAIK